MIHVVPFSARRLASTAVEVARHKVGGNKILRIVAAAESINMAMLAILELFIVKANVGVPAHPVKYLRSDPEAPLQSLVLAQGQNRYILGQHSIRRN